MYLNMHGNLPSLRFHYLLLAAVAIGVTVPVLAISLRAATPQLQNLPTQEDVGFGKLPLSFEPNMGQTSDEVRYLVHAKGGTFFFTPSEVVLSLATVEQDANKTIKGLETDVAPRAIDSHTIRVRFDGASTSPEVVADEALPGRVNYLIGNEPDKWRTHIPTYAGVTYKELYPGISLSYAGTEGLLKGTYTVASGIDPATIKWRYIGASSTSIDGKGNLIISIGDAGTLLTERAPVVWQQIGGEQVPVEVRYSIRQDGSIGFALGNYDKAYPLTIDPTLTYSTYLGGSGGDEGYGIDIDASGNMYIVGLTASTNYPTVNAYQPTYRGGTDAFVSKMNPAGTALVYSTYLGGTALDQGFAIAVDSMGRATITGNTNSSNFPVENAYQGTYGGGLVDSFATQLGVTGSVLVYSTYLGGSGFDTGQGVAFDDTGSAYIAGLSNSANFPVINAYQPINAGSQDVTVTKLSPNVGAPGYSTYLGGSGDDFGRAIDVDGTGNAYVTGSTISNNFPVMNAYQPTCRNNCTFDDSFVTKFNAAGSALLYSTFIGGNIQETGYGIAADSAGNAYSTGTTSSLNFPTRNPFQPNFVNYIDAYVTKINTTLSGDASLIYSTYLGGGSVEYGYDIAVDSAAQAYVTGYAGDGFPVRNPFQQGYGGGGADAFITVFTASGSNLVYSSYLGGEANDFGRGVAIDGAGTTYIGGSTASTLFPTVSPFQSTFGGGTNDAFLAKVYDGPTVTVTPVIPTATATTTSVPSTHTATSTFVPPTTTTTATPIAPTSTSVPPTVSSTAPASATTTSTSVPPTACPIQFTDVPASNSFYENVRCLACRGIVSGYSDGTFRPNNQVTRGQLAKMVSNSAGFTEPVSGQIFEDVPPTYTFYEFIERLTIRGHMTGYVCGSPGEPCTTGRPYFRPQANATRGQTSKIVSNAAGFIEPPVGQTFQDVPPTHTFYAEIQRLATRNVMQGYTCGGPFEPCVAPENRPYFRPGNDVTRGQSAKIVANTFFVNCVTP